MVDFLVNEVGVNINKKDIFGRTPMESALELESKEIAELVCSKALASIVKLNREFVIEDVNRNNLINCKMNFDRE